MRHFIITAAASAVLGSLAFPAAAEVVEQDERGFVTRDLAVVSATPKQVWLALISPAKWWNSAHTWSGDSANLTITPQAGGCFCETIPEVSEPGRFTLEGSVEHLRVVQAHPETALRMEGALGPLQSEPVGGVLTIAISTVDEGTRIVWEYHVGGRMRYPVPVIAQAVDGVMSQQLDGLATMLGRVDEPARKASEAPKGKAKQPDDPGSKPGGDGAGSDPEPSVDEAFGDLSDEG
jgi:hypothetical protein